VELDESEVVIRRGFRTTSLPGTLFDLSRKLSLAEAVVVTDMALHAGLVGRAELSDWIERADGRAYVVRGTFLNLPNQQQSRRWKRAFGCCWCQRITPSRGAGHAS
jgi:hypothetical protein